MREFIGIEIGGTKQQAASFDENGNMLAVFSERVPLVRGAEDILDWMKIVVPKLKSEKTVAMGIGFGGIVDTDEGLSACSVQVPGWEKFNLKKWFEATFSLPAVVVNDTVCGGYAEVLFGTGKDVDRFFYTNIGTGCGGAMFINGKNYDGLSTGGAYHGQIYVPAWDEPARVVRMEAICSGSSIEKRLRTPGYVPQDSMIYGMCGGDTAAITCKHWGDAAKQGDAFALAELDRWAKTYAIALSTMITVMAPRKVSIGGGVTNIGSILLDAIRKYTDELVFVSMKDRYEIVQCESMDMAVLIGAAMYARDGFQVIT